MIGLDFNELSVEFTKILQKPEEKCLILDVLVKEVMDQAYPHWEDFYSTYLPHKHKLEHELQLLCADIEFLRNTIQDATLRITGVNLYSTSVFILEFNLDEIYRRNDTIWQ